MANIKQDELWVDLLFDGTASFYLALAESKRFRIGYIRNGKISYRLYPKRKDCVSLNVAIKNLASLPLEPQQSGLCFFSFVMEQQMKIQVHISWVGQSTSLVKEKVGFAKYFREYDFIWGGMQHSALWKEYIQPSHSSEVHFARMSDFCNNAVDLA